MKKSLIALAVVAASGAAMAQSSVTLFGVADVGIGNYKGATSATRVTTSGLSSSRIGFRGVEDLGGGMHAGFWLEAGHNPDSGVGQATNTNNQASGAQASNGGLTFNRRSTIDIGGAWGAIRLGRDYTPEFWSKTSFDPFGTLGVAQSSNLNLAGNGPAGVRASNSVSYLYGYAANANSVQGAGGVYAQLMYAAGENASGAATSSDGNTTGLRVGYVQPGKIDAAIATQTTKNAGVGNYKGFNIAGSYNLGVANLMAQYGTQKAGNGTINSKYTLVGATIPLGAGYIPVSYTQYKSDVGTKPSANQFGIGYVHNLSKRTALYTAYARIGNKNGAAFAVANSPAAAVNGASSGFEVGLRHVF